MLNLVRVLLPLLLLLFVSAAPLLANGDEDMMDCAPLRLADLGGELFISIRHYAGVDPDDFESINENTRQGFVPIISAAEGFVLYALTNVPPDQVLAVNVFQSEEEMQASNEKAADFIAENLAPYLPEAPQITAGDIVVLALPGQCTEMHEDGQGEERADAADEEAPAGEVPEDMPAMFFGFRRYSGFDPADVPAIVELTRDVFALALAESPGFQLYLSMVADDETTGGALNIFGTAEEMQAANENAVSFVSAELAELLPEAPTIISGDVAIFHVADLEAMMGMEEEMEGEGE